MNTFQKTLAVSDFYFDASDWPYPLGLLQMCAKAHADQIRGEAMPSWLEWLPDIPFDVMARHSMDFWLSSEDLPRPENRIRIDADGRVILELTPNNREAHHRLRAKLEHAGLLMSGGRTALVRIFPLCARYVPMKEMRI